MGDNTCPFCRENEKEIEDLVARIVKNIDGGGYAFVPRTPLIFGHILLTVDKETTKKVAKEGCYHDFWDTPRAGGKPPKKAVPDELLKLEIVGVKKCMEGLRRIPLVKRIYLVVAGEDKNVHHHFHLIPRYKPIWNEKDEKEWRSECELVEGCSEWKRFYRLPWDLCHWGGFQYLGELEKRFNDFRNYVMKGENPKLLLKEMAKKVKACMESTE